MIAYVRQNHARALFAPAAWCCLALAAWCSVDLGTGAVASAATPVLDNEERALCQQVNALRSQHGLAPLRASVTLTRAARWLSADMARNDYLDHTDSRGRTFSKRLTAFGYKGAARAENIAGGSGSAAATLSDWQSSPLHRRNLLNPSLKVIGIGRAYNASSMLGWHWTATFGGKLDRTLPC
jgi:uncharacterized protein YkwD